MNRIILAALVGVLVSGPVEAAEDDKMRGQRLSGVEIKRFYSGAKVNVLSTEDYPLVSDGDVFIKYESDGVMYGEHIPSGTTDWGKWWVKDDKRCRSWDTWVGGFTDCFIITLEKGDFIRVYNIDGSFHASSKLIKGPGLTQSSPTAPTANPTTTSAPKTPTTATTPTVKTPQRQGDGTVEERLAKLKELLDNGLITPGEAAAKRKEILEGL